MIWWYGSSGKSDLVVNIYRMEREGDWLVSGVNSLYFILIVHNTNGREAAIKLIGLTNPRFANLT